MSSDVPILVKILSIGGSAAYSAGTKLFPGKCTQKTTRLDDEIFSQPEVNRGETKAKVSATSSLRELEPSSVSHDGNEGNLSQVN